MRRSMLVCAALLAAGVESAQAQPSRGVQRPAAATSSTRRGVEVSPQPNPAPTATPFGVPSPHVVAVKLVPAVIMSDGSVFADFGFGLEPVRRACGGVGGLGETRSLSGGVFTSTSLLPGIQPAPAQRTASQQNLTSQIQPSQRITSRVALGSCFTRDASGRVFATR